MTTETATVHQILEKCRTGRWNMPEWQRDFVWSARQVAELAESLAMDEALGAFYLWVPRNQNEAEPRLIVDEAHDAEGFILDGQQRATAFCLLFGIKPVWLSDTEWSHIKSKRKIVVNVHTGEFAVGKSKLRIANGWVPAPDVFSESSGQRMKLLRQVAGADGSDDVVDELLNRVTALRNQLTGAAVPVFRKVRDLTSAYRAFEKLNNNGTNVTQAQLHLAYIATVNPAFGREQFTPFLAELKERNWDVQAQTVLRTLTGTWVQRTTLSEVSHDLYATDNDGFLEAWKLVQRGWERTITYFADYGIITHRVIPATSPLVPIVYLAVRFPEALTTGLPLKWLLHTSRVHRYDKASARWVDEDLRAIRDADTWQEAVAGLFGNLEASAFAPFTAEELKGLQVANVSSKLARLVYALAIFQGGAKDWKTGRRLTWSGLPRKALSNLDTDWHHVFPRKYLSVQGVPAELIDSMANISLVSHSTNVEMSDTAPHLAIAAVGTDPQRLTEQLVPAVEELESTSYGAFLDARARGLARLLGEFLDSLGEPPVTSGHPARAVDTGVADIVSDALTVPVTV